MITKTLTAVFIAILALFCFPLFIGLLGGIFGMVMGVFGGILGAIGAVFGTIVGGIGSIFHVTSWFFNPFCMVVAILLIVLLVNRSKYR